MWVNPDYSGDVHHAFYEEEPSAWKTPRLLHTEWPVPHVNAGSARDLWGRQQHAMPMDVDFDAEYDRRFAMVSPAHRRAESQFEVLVERLDIQQSLCRIEREQC